MSIFQHDKELELTVSNLTDGGTVYSGTGLDLGSTDYAQGVPIEIVCNFTKTGGTTGSATFTVMGENTDSTIDGSSIATASAAALTGTGQVVLAVPSNFAYRWIGVRVVGATDLVGTTTAFVQPRL